MKYVLIITAFLMSILTVQGQDIMSVFVGQTFSDFRYKDSEGNKQRDVFSKIGYSYGVNYKAVVINNVFVVTELSYRQMGAENILNNQLLKWDLHYFNVNLGGEYRHRCDGAITIFGGASLYYSQMFRGIQSIGNNYYDLIEEEALKRSDFGLDVYTGLTRQVGSTCVSFELRSTNGLIQLEKRPPTDQRLFNVALTFRVGLMFNLL
jgi:hypothetical protein